MNVIGIATVFCFLFCLWSLLQTGRTEWIGGLIWCVPLLLIVEGRPTGENLNGLVIVICFFMILFCVFPIFKVKLWNVSKRKTISLPLFFFMMLQTGYCIFQTPQLAFLYGFLSEYQPGSGAKVLFFVVIKVWILLAVIAGIALASTKIMIGAADRFFSKRESLTLLRCRVFYLGVFRRFYFLEGIRNGITYHFQITPLTYFALRRKKIMTLELNMGCLGGMYGVKVPPLEQEERGLKRKRKRLWTEAIFFMIIGMGMIYFLLFR